MAKKNRLKKVTGDKVAQIRTALGLSHIQFAAKIGVSKKVLTKTETGTGEIANYFCNKIMEKLPVKHKWMFLDEGKMFSCSKINLDKLIAEIKQAPSSPG